MHGSEAESQGRPCGLGNPELKQAGRESRDKLRSLRLGVWGDPNAIKPWDYRRTER